MGNLTLLRVTRVYLSHFTPCLQFLGPIFFFLYVAVVSIGLMSMFLTIINDALSRVKANAHLQSNDYEIVDFVWRKFKGVFGWGG